MKNLIINLSLAIGSIIFALFAAELVVRDYKAGFENLILANNGDLLEQHFRGLYNYDPMLGWVPGNNVSAKKWGSLVSTEDDGIRSNGQARPAADDERILAIGDSFTFGDYAKDNETWPAYLEKILNEKVYNGGVSSYGIDQMYLRTQQLAPKYKPTILIFDFIMEDVERCSQYVRQGVAKPYFDIENDALVLKNEPVQFLKNTRPDWFRRTFGYSYLCHKIMNKFFPAYWYMGTAGSDFRTVDNSPVLVTLRLLEKIGQIGNDKNIHTMILVEGGYSLDDSPIHSLDPILANVKLRFPNTEIVDLLPFLAEFKKEKPLEFKTYYASDSAHMSSKGNALVAYILANKIKSLNW
jgi:lysophospholipase L1-like esterase